MAFPYNAIAGKDRVLFETYDSVPDMQVVAASYYGSNDGFHGYIGGIKYIYFVAGPGVGEINFNLRNIFNSSYNGVAADSGVFDFNLSLGTLSCLYAEVVTPAPLVTPVGNVLFSFNGSGIIVQYFSGGVAAAFPANATVHLNICFVRNVSSAIGVAGSGVNV